MATLRFAGSRFWLPRGELGRLDEHGYLRDPDSQYGSILNPHARRIDAIEDLPCLVLLGEPGMGKTTTLNLHRAKVAERVDRARDYLIDQNLNAYQTDATLRRSIFESASYRGWLDGEGLLHLFLDSLDECLIRIDTVATILEDEFARSPVERLRLRLTCRTAEWPASLEAQLKENWGEDAVGVFELAPLRHIDVFDAARAFGLDPEQFLAEVEARDAVPLASRPVTLIFLLNTFASGRELPRTQAELYRVGCQILCGEVNEQRRRSSQLRGRLDASQRLVLAARIAAAAVFCGRSSIWTGPDLGDVPDGDLTIVDLLGSHVGEDGERLSVTESAVREVLDTGLFSSRGAGRMGFAHNTYAEFLAAHYLHACGAEEPQIASLLLHPGDTDGKVVPQLHEVSAWLAGMEAAFFRRVMRGDPQVLLRSDVASVEEGDRRKLVDSLLQLFDAGKLSDRDWELRSRYRKLDHQGLSDQLTPYIKDRSRGETARRFALNLAERCRLTSLQGLMAELALDPEEAETIRIPAASAVAQIGDEDTRRRLWPYLQGMAGSDSEDELKACALQALWPGLITFDEVLAAITPPKRPNLLGRYRFFLYDALAKHVAPENLPSALEWADSLAWDARCSVEVERILDRLIEAALPNLDDPRTREAFAKVVTSRIMKYRPILKQHEWSELEIRTATDLRRRIALSVIPLLGSRSAEPALLFSSDPPLLTSGDLPWLLECLKDESNQVPRRVWTRLIRSGYRGDPDRAEMILGAMAEHDDLERELKDYFQPIELDSDLARKLRADYADHVTMTGERRRRVASVEPPPRDRVERCLSAIEAGDVDAWTRLNLEMTLTPQSTRYGPSSEVDLTVLPGWETADEITRERITEAAYRYLMGDRCLDESWIEGEEDEWDLPTLAGYRALRLIDRRRPGGIEALGANIWRRWAPAVIDFPGAIERADDEIRGPILKLAYRHAPDRIVAIFIRLIDRDNQDHGYISSLDVVVRHCWDTRLSAALLAKAGDERLKSRCLGQLLLALIGRGVQGAEELARTMIPIPLPVEGGSRERAFTALSALADGARDGGWSVIESMLVQDPAACRELFLKLGSRTNHAGFANRLSEDNLARLYRWFVDQFPHEEDPEEEGYHPIGDRELVGQLRDAILKQLYDRGTTLSQRAVERLADELPHLEWLRRVAIEAAAITLRKTWNPPSPADVLALVADGRKRLVESGSQLLDVLTESIARLEQELQGETPIAPALWDEVRPKVFRPKDENWLSDFVAAHLRRDLSGRGVVVSREVEIRPGCGTGQGERTDIHVDAVVRGTNDRISAIIEVKGCWHRDLRGAMRSQLRDRYLRENLCRHGLYLVGWYPCQQWEPADLARKRPPFQSREEMRSFLEAQATEISSDFLLIRSCVLNATLR